MSRDKTIRFACGTPDAPRSSIWRIVINRKDVYIGSSKASMGLLKISLHESGVWVYAATRASGISLLHGTNRRAYQWRKHLARAGITRGPSILIPWTTAQPSSPVDPEKKVHWVPQPPPASSVEFSIYFVAEGAALDLDLGEYLVAEERLRDATRLVLLVSVRCQSEAFRASVSDLQERESLTVDAIRPGLDYYALWMTTSKCEIGHPVIVQAPVNVYVEPELARI